MWGYHGIEFGGGAMGIGMLVFWGLIVAAIVVAIRGLGGARPAGSESATRGTTPLDILGERYAKGEIGKDEFEQKKRDLAS